VRRGGRAGLAADVAAVAVGLRRGGAIVDVGGQIGHRGRADDAVGACGARGGDQDVLDRGGAGGGLGIP
jgi:hypothetical protein